MKYLMRQGGIRQSGYDIRRSHIPVSYTHLSVPAGEAYTLFDWFLTELSGRCPGTEILIIAGNHDSPERLAYGASFLARHRIHIAALPPADRTEYLKQVTLCLLYTSRCV